MQKIIKCFCFNVDFYQIWIKIRFKIQNCVLGCSSPGYAYPNDLGVRVDNVPAQKYEHSVVHDTKYGIRRAKQSVLACSCKSALKRLLAKFPILFWFPSYVAECKTNMISDLVAAVTVMAVLIPQAIAYGQLSNAPAVYGIYTAFVPLLIYSAMGTSKHMCVGPFALIMSLVGSAVETVCEVPATTPEGEQKIIDAAIIVGLFTGLMSLVMGILGLGFISVLLSDPVLSGFLLAASILIPSSQLKHAFGVSEHIGHGNLWPSEMYKVVHAVSRGHTTWMAFGIFVCSVLFLIFCRHANKSWDRFKQWPLPGELIVVIFATIITWALNLHETSGVAILGGFPSGFPPMGMPKFESLTNHELGQLGWMSAIITLITFLTASSVGKTFSRKHKYPYDSNQELIAFGVCGIVGSFFGSLPVAASLSRSAVADTVGVKSQFHGMFTGLMMLIVLMFMSTLLEPLPQAVLAAVVLTSFIGLFWGGISDCKEFWRRASFLEFGIFAIAFTCTLTLGVTNGLMLSIGCNIIFLFYKEASPKCVVMGRIIDGLREDSEPLYRSIAHFPEAQRIPGILIFRFGSSLHFANIAFFEQSLMSCVESEQRVLSERDAAFYRDRAINAFFPSNLKYAIVDFRAVEYVDITALRGLKRVRAELHKRGIVLLLSMCCRALYKDLDCGGFFGDPERYKPGAREKYDTLCFREIHGAVIYATCQLSMKAGRDMAQEISADSTQIPPVYVEQTTSDAATIREFTCEDITPDLILEPMEVDDPSVV